MPRSPLLRALTLLYALLHLLVPPLVAVSDAQLQREAVATAQPGLLHMESEGSSRCPRIHPLDCGLCLAIAAFPLVARPEQLLLAEERVCASPSESRLGHHAPGRYALALPRAPPAS